VEQTFTPCGEFSCTDTCERSHSLTIHKWKKTVVVIDAVITFLCCRCQ
jgi:hypothetical protein